MESIAVYDLFILGSTHLLQNGWSFYVSRQPGSTAIRGYSRLSVKSKLNQHEFSSKELFI